jgi:ATP-dependent protease ClpP protease subunit
MTQEESQPILLLRRGSVVLKVSGSITGIIRDNLLDQLNLARRAARVTDLILLIDSPGGAIHLGVELYEELTRAIREQVIALTTYNLANTDSTALYLFGAGSRRWAAATGTFLLHNADFVSWESDTEEMRENGLLAAAEQTSRMAKALAQLTGQRQTVIADILRAAKRRDAQYAKDLGLVHEIGSIQQEEGCRIADITKRRGDPQHLDPTP